MSFSIDLWNGLNIIKERFVFTYNKVQLLYNIFNSFINMEKDYTKNLDILYKDHKDHIKEEFLLDTAFIQLLEMIKDQSEHHKKHIDFIIKYLTSPLKEILDNQKSYFQLFVENTKNFENLEKSKNNVISKEEKYHNSCNELTLFLISNDSNSINTSFSNNKSAFNKRQKLLDRINENKKEYLSLLYEANIDLDQYNINTSQIMDELENKYESIIDLLKWSLINYTNNRIVLYDKINNINKEILQKYFTNIDCNKEIMDFIKKYATKEFPIFKYEFIPYKLNSININLFKENERKKNRNECNKKINLIKKFFTDNNLISNIFPKDSNNNTNNNNTNTNTNTNENNISIINNSIKKLISIEKEAIKKPNIGLKKRRNISQELNYNSLNNINTKFILKDRESQMKSNLTYIEFFIDKLMIKKNETKKNEIEKFKNVFLLNKNENAMYFDLLIKTLNEYRAKGKYVVCNNTFDILVEVFIFLLDNFPDRDNLLKNLLILAQTFCYIKQNDKKTYIQKGIRNHIIFSNSKLWHRVINYTLGQNVNNKDISKKVDRNEINKKIKVLALNTLIAYLCDLKCFTDDKQVFDEVKKFYCDIYKLNEEEVNKSVEISHEEMNISRTVTEGNI